MLLPLNFRPLVWGWIQKRAYWIIYMYKDYVTKVKSGQIKEWANYFQIFVGWK